MFSKTLVSLAETVAALGVDVKKTEQSAASGFWQEPSPLVEFHFVCPDGQDCLHPACLGSSAVKDLISGPSGCFC